MTSEHLEFDVRRALRHLRRVDGRLAVVIRTIGPFHLSLRLDRSPFEALLRAIIYQQLSGRAAAAIHTRLLGLFPGSPTPRGLLALRAADLRGAGLSHNKILALRDLASRTMAGGVPGFSTLRGMLDDEVIARLTAVRGIGRWTVEMLLIFNLGRPDILPVHDLGIRKGFQVAYGMKRLPATATLTRTGRLWSPYRSVASWYLWRVLDSPM